MRGVIRGHQRSSAAIIHLFEAHARDTARAGRQSGNHHNTARRQVISANQCQSFIPPVQADRVVTTTTRPAVFAVSVLMARVEPALKPYHPSHRIKVPSTCMQLGG
jgi:hypothetical protein